MSNNFKATVQLVTEVDYSSIEKVNPNEVAKRLSKAYGPVTKKLFRDPFLQLSKEYAKSNLKFYDKNKLKSFSRDLQMEYAKSAVAYADARAKLDKDASNVNAKRQEKASAMAMRSIEKQYKLKMDEESALLDKRKKISDKIDREGSKSWGSRLGEMSSWFLGTIDKGLAENSDVYKFGRDQFTATKEFAEVELDEAAVKGLKSGASSLEKAAGSLAKSSKALAVGAAGSAGIIALITKLLMKANKYGMDFNKNMLEGASYIDLGATNAKDLIRNLGAVRSAAEDLSLIEFRTTTEENLKVLKLLNQQAVSYRALAGDIDNTKEATANLTKVIRQAHYFSNLLGLSLEEVTEKQAVLFKDLGYNAETMDDAFHSLARGAEISGFNTKRFYSMVLQSTSGMAAYNMRIEEASSLLNTLTSALGTNANELLQTLTKGFAGEDMAQSFKRFLMMGRKNVREIFNRSSENMAEKFAKDFRKQSSDIVKAFRDSGVKLDIDAMTLQTSEGQKKMVQALSGLNPKKQAELIARVRETSGNKTANQFKKLVEVSQGMKGSFEGFAKGSSQLDMTSKLIAQLRAVEGTIKVPLYAMNETQLQYYRNATGVSGDQLMMLRDLSRMLHGNYDILKQDLELAKSGKLTDEELQKKQLKLAQSTGATIAKVGDSWKIVSATVKKVEEDGIKKMKTIIGDAEIKSAEQLASTQEGLFKKMLEEPLTAEMKITQEIVAQTRSLNKVVGSVTNSLLGRIYDTTQGILGMMPGNKLTEAEKANKQLALSQIAIQEETIKKAQLDSQRQIESLEKAMASASGEKKEALRPQHATAVAMERALGDQVKELESMRRGVINTTTSGVSDYFVTTTGEDKTVSDFLTGGAEGGDKTLTTQASEYVAGIQGKYRDAMGGVGPALENYLRSPETKENFETLEKGFESGMGALMSFFGEDNEEVLKKEEQGATKRHKDSEKLVKDNHKDNMEIFDKMWNTLDYIQKADAMKAIGSLTSLPSELRNEAIEALATTGRLPEHIARQLSPEDRNRLYEDFGYNPPVDDFIIQGNTVTPIDKRDTLVGYKTGGAITQARDSGRVATPSAPVNHVTINAQGATVELILEALRRAGVTK